MLAGCRAADDGDLVLEPNIASALPTFERVGRVRHWGRPARAEVALVGIMKIFLHVSADLTASR
jgi:hypothetical protein